MENTKRPPKGLFTVEGWNGLACEWFVSGIRAASIQKRAEQAVCDYGATRVLVYRIADAYAPRELVAECDSLFIWRNVTNEHVAQAIR